MPQRTPAPPTPAAPWQASRTSRVAGPVLFAAALLFTIFGLATVGLPEGLPGSMGVLAAAASLIGGLITPLLYLLGALGLGRPLAALLVGRSKSRVHLQLALGVGAMLWLSHGAGVLGLLSEHGPLGAGCRVAAWGMVALGLVLLAHQVVMGPLRPERWPVFPLALTLWAPALGITAIAACNPVGGGLWSSEFGGYDAMSYHLQLAKEWAAGPVGRIWPGEHNVYAYLPSYMEAAFTHLAALSIGRGDAVTRMIGDESRWVYSCQLLHLGMGVVAAILAARLIAVLAERAGASGRIAAFGGIAGAALLLGTPWTVVVGSMAYNELAMLAMLAGALLACADADLRPGLRGVIVGGLVGIACSAKPTALLLVGPAAGIALLALPTDRESRTARARAAAVACGAIAGIVAIAPWLVRNALASGGNPVFPFAADLLGRDRWTAEQVARYARAHIVDLGLWQRLTALVSPSGLAPTPGEQARGFGHEQWAYVPWIGVISLAIVIAWRPTRRAGLVLAGALASQLIAWLAFTHVQSRFLLPLLVPLAAAFGLGAVAVLSFATRRIGGAGGAGDGAAQRLPLPAAVVLGLLPLTAAGWSAINFTRQSDAHPNRALALGAGGLSGMSFEPSLARASDEERRRFLDENAGPAAYVNLALRAQSAKARAGTPTGLYLLGDATPLYYLDALGDEPSTLPDDHDARPMKVYYHTTWDASPLGDAIAGSPADPAAWSAWMRARGIGYVLVNYGELGRLIEHDHNFDPRVTLPLVGAWVAPYGPGGLRSVRKWTIPAGGGAGGRADLVASELFAITGGEPEEHDGSKTQP